METVVSFKASPMPESLFTLNAITQQTPQCSTKMTRMCNVIPICFRPYTLTIMMQHHLITIVLINMTISICILITAVNQFLI